MSHHNLKLQSAMEYLMTYGWAILIIAVVLGALFQLGVFNATNFAPKAPPGSCRVTKLGGNFNLLGVCSGQLPQYVALFDPNWPVQQTSVIDTGSWVLPYESGTNSISFTVWYYLPFVDSNSDGWPWVIGSGSSGGSDGYLIYVGTGSGGAGNPGQLAYRRYASSAGIGFSSGGVISIGWHFLAMTYNGLTLTGYLDGSSQGSENSASSLSGTSHFYIVNYGYGSIANVQAYNVALDANQIQALYIKGIGGAPISPQYLVGWWPLNGDANDYSGNNNNGVPTSVVYTSSWVKGYTPP